MSNNQIRLPAELLNAKIGDTLKVTPELRQYFQQIERRFQDLNDRVEALEGA